MDISSAIDHYPLILTECAISERLRRREDLKLHPILFNTPLIYDSHGRKCLQEIYGGYAQIALQAKLPMLLCAPTWRVDRERTAAAGVGPSIIKDAIAFMQELTEQLQQNESPLYLGALLAPKNDCYSPEAALSRNEASSYHTWQIDQLVSTGIDVIIAQTMPSVSEAWGMAEALATTSVPYIISFVIDRECRVLDSTPLAEAMSTIDNGVTPAPIGYMVNCVYPTFLCPDQQGQDFFSRMIGIQANSSSKDHTQLDGSEILQQDPLPDWTKYMTELNRKYRVKILGGCCGTDETYLQSLAV